MINYIIGLPKYIHDFTKINYRKVIVFKGKNISDQRRLIARTIH